MTTHNNEKRLLRTLVTDALAAGFVCSVDDGGDEYAVSLSADKAEILDALHNTDEDRLFLHDRKPTNPGEVYKGWVYLIYGNGNSGLDMVSDYTTNIEDVMTGVNDLAHKMELTP